MAGKPRSHTPVSFPERGKITIKLDFADLGQLELPAREVSRSGRSDLIRTAILQQLLRHAELLKPTIRNGSSRSA